MSEFVSCGDSWLVELPFDMGTGGGIAKALFGDVMGVDFTNIAHAGDSTEELMGTSVASKLESVIPGAKILLFSGGGDDFAGDQFEIFLNDNRGQGVADAVNHERLSAGFDLTVADYERLVEIRDALAPDCLIVTHTYDFPPAGMLGRGFLTYGPWLKPGLVHRGWTDPVDQVLVVRDVLIAFAARMAAFAAQQRRYCHTDTQGTVAPQDWANELHLTGVGCRKIAERLNLSLLPLL